MAAIHGMLPFVVLTLCLPGSRADDRSPGRWFVALQLKLLTAYVIAHYEIERLEHRPLHRIIGSHFVPPKINIKVKRRKGTSYI